MILIILTIYIIDVDIFSYIFGQILYSLTLSNPKTQCNCERRGYFSIICIYEVIDLNIFIDLRQAKCCRLIARLPATMKRRPEGTEMGSWQPGPNRQ